MSERRFPAVTPLRPAWQIALLAGVLAGGIGLTGGWLMGTHGPRSFAWNNWLMLGVGVAMAFAGTTWAAAQWMSPSGRAGFWRTLTGLAIAVAGICLGARAEAFVPSLAGMCLGYGSMVAMATAAAMLFVFWRTAPMMRHRVAVAAGVLSGLSGFVAIQIHCANSELWHMMSGHAALPVLWGLLGYWVTRLAFR